MIKDKYYKAALRLVCVVPYLFYNVISAEP